MQKLDDLFSGLCGDKWAMKTMSHNDEDKGGLYVTKAMQRVMAAAGVDAVLKNEAENINFELLDPDRSKGHLSYYESQRDNRPEVRMGREMISSWLTEGDLFYIGWTGKKLIAAKFTPGVDSEAEKLAVALERTLSLSDLRAKAGKAKKKPARRLAQRTEFERDPTVIAYVLKRAGESCEMPDCASPLFRKPNGSVYLEVHHAIPLAENGDDSFKNTAALCPNCHRAQHHAENKGELRAALSATILSKESRLPDFVIR